MLDSGILTRLFFSLANYLRRYAPLFLTFFLLSASQAKADPILFESGVIVGHPLAILLAGLALETLILARIARLPFFHVLPVTLSANLISGFVGLISWLHVRIEGETAYPLGWAFVFAILIEIPIIYIMLYNVPFKKVVKGITFAKLVNLCIGLILLTPLILPARIPTTDEDLEFSRNVADIRLAVEKYHQKYNEYPKNLIGGSKCVFPGKTSDPLLDAGILDTYPDNPYTDSLRSMRFNPAFLLFGLGDPLVPVNFSSPTNSWECRWFPALVSDPRFGDPGVDGNILCANGLSDLSCIETLSNTFYNMNGADIIPGCIFYKSYDFNFDGLTDDYILGGFGWPGGIGTVMADIIDCSNGNICLSILADGSITAGQPDGIPEPLTALYIAGMH